jgi:hypothetical protein
MIVIGAEVVVLPALSRAITVNVWLPSVAVAEFQLMEYGAAVISEATSTPSTRKRTPAIPLVLIGNVTVAAADQAEVLFDGSNAFT